MLIRMFVTNWVARLGGWLDWVAKTLRYFEPQTAALFRAASLGERFL